MFVRWLRSKRWRDHHYSRNHHRTRLSGTQPLQRTDSLKVLKRTCYNKTFQFMHDCQIDSNISKVEYFFLDWSGALRQDEQMTSWFIGSNIHYFMCAIFKLNMFLLKKKIHDWLTDHCLNGVVPKCPNDRIQKIRIGGIIVFATEKGVFEAYFRTMWMLIFQWRRGTSTSSLACTF